MYIVTYKYKEYNYKENQMSMKFNSFNEKEKELIRRINIIVSDNSSVCRQMYSMSECEIGFAEEAAVVLEKELEINREKLARFQKILDEKKLLVKELTVELGSVKKSNLEIIKEILAKEGFDWDYVAGEIGDVERMTNYARRDGFFRSSDQGKVYTHLSNISDYLAKFDNISNDELKEFTDLHVKKLFKLDFQRVKDFVSRFEFN